MITAHSRFISGRAQTRATKNGQQHELTYTQEPFAMGAHGLLYHGTDLQHSHCRLRDNVQQPRNG